MGGLYSRGGVAGGCGRRRSSRDSAAAPRVRHVLAALVANPRAPLRRLEPLLSQVPKGENVLGVHDDAGYNLLQRCVGLNRVELVRWLLARHGLDANRCPCSLPLHIACLRGYEECVELLLRRGARVDAEARMCFPGTHHHNCEEYGKSSVFDGGVPSNQGYKLQSAIYYAIDGDQINIMNMLAQKMEKPWMPFRVRKPLLHIACERAAWKCVQHLVNVRSDELHTIKDENYPIHLAVLHDIKFLELLINHGADPCVKTCTQQMTLLHIILLIARKSAEETLSIVKFLLEHGCKDIINTPDGLGNTPLHALIVRYSLEEAHYGCERWNKWGVLNLARHLLQAGAGQSINQPGNSALASALRNVRDWDVCYELLNMMLAHGGDPNIVGRDGSVPIMVCLVPLINKDPLHHFTHSMKVCYLNCIRILLKYGASPNCSYRGNLTPLHVLVFSMSENMTLNCGAEKRANFEYIEDLLVLLLRHGLDCNLRVPHQEQHILQSCVEMVRNARTADDVACVHQLALTLVRHGADADARLSSRSLAYRPPEAPPPERRDSLRGDSRNTLLYYYVALIAERERLLADPEATFAKIINLMRFAMEHRSLCATLRSLRTQHVARVPAKATEALVATIRELCRAPPRTLKQAARYRIYRCVGRKPALHVDKLMLPASLKEYIMDFEA